MAFTQALPSYRKVTIDFGDTLQKIALRELGDASLWISLASINNLLPPYIVSNLADATSNQVLFAGGTIMVPSPTITETGSTDEDSVFGTDLALVNGMLTDDGAGDLAVVADVANLTQAMEARLETRQGELMRHPKYGNRVYELIGKGNNPVNIQLAAGWASKCVASDPRISEVESMTATASGDQIIVDGTAMAIDGKKLPVGTTIGS